MDNPTLAMLAGLRKAFLALRSSGELAELLAVRPALLAAAVARPRYYRFEVPKKDGSKRLIEDPDDRLQPLQDGLNDYLQAVYWHDRSPAAYGFLLVPEGDPTPRHIETNAARHLGQPWLLNCDLEDFFHQITQERVRTLFAGPPFGFTGELPGLLAALTTFKGRCPMGAPTSPVLSNLVFAAVDHDLLELTHRRGWTYTRYADDMSFSSQKRLDMDDYAVVQRLVGRHDFVFNPAKVQLFGPEDAKTITGLLLTPTGLEVPASFIPELSDDIRQLAGAMQVLFRSRPHDLRSTDRFRRSVEGKLRFAGRIMGDKHRGVAHLWKAYREAVKPPTAYEQRSWLDFGYF